jgi:hypothetical protein
MNTKPPLLRVVFIQPPPPAPNAESFLDKQPLACQGVLAAREQPLLLRTEWFVACIKGERILDTAPFELVVSPPLAEDKKEKEQRVPLADVQLEWSNPPPPPLSSASRLQPPSRFQSQPRDGDGTCAAAGSAAAGGGGGASCSSRVQSDAARSKRVVDDREAIIDVLMRYERSFTAEAATANAETLFAATGSRAACMLEEISLARYSLIEWATTRIASRHDFNAFASQGFPGYVGRTTAIVSIIVAELDPVWAKREEELTLALEEEKRNQPKGKKRRSRDDYMAGSVMLLDLPDEVIAKCLERLPMLDLLAAAASCRRLNTLALGTPLTCSNQPQRLPIDRANPAVAAPPEKSASLTEPRWPGRDHEGGVRGVRALRVMTWNLKNNNSNPKKRFANQPGAGQAAKNGGWHWYSKPQTPNPIP